MDNTYIGMGFLILCSCTGIALILGFASITNYYVHIAKERLEVSPATKETSITNNTEQG